ncbi:nucleolar complex-associated protein-domain-containing protein [Gymnopilus junonius]|uniref:Nucleolar complex-associated protein 3 n=1 Tax=Gymnopilus junonius TaxID=109634 RepID=A0A9P5NPN1_GYMJU|nr:nucleolar complex-associated protein-domain-containing protein [Gymnopilus junonius]
MTANSKSKRPAPTSQTSSKKRKLNNGKQKNLKELGKTKSAKKDKAYDRAVIPIPEVNDDDDIELSDEDIRVLEFGGAAAFLNNLDRMGIMRSKKETQRLHNLTKPIRKQEVKDDLPPVDSNDEDDWSSGIGEDSDNTHSENEDGSFLEDASELADDSDVEMSYEVKPRKQHEWESNESTTKVKGLPIKLANGMIQQTGSKSMTTRPPSAPLAESSSSDEEQDEEPEQKVEDVSTGARFGRPAVVDILKTDSRKAKVEMAKNQIAGICQEILADPENSLGLLRRLHTFSLEAVTTPTHPEPVPNDPIIRKLSILSQLAILKDIIPGYRIRALTDAEKAEKVSQMVARTRDWEQGLVTVYQSYLRLLENELKSRSVLADTVLHCMCTLLREVTHFNFRANLMTCIVTHLSKKSWDKTSDLCSQTLIDVFRSDLTGTASLEVVRLLNRMIKERRFKIHPNVLSCLLHLRLRTELGVRASDTHANKPETNKTPRNGKAKKPEQVHLSKKAKKALKEQKGIDKDLREAGAEVDKEERNTTQTETLKLLFSLYFRILKNPRPTPLLPSALSGISKFAHLVNIDFFKDLMKVLKDLILMEEEAASENVDIESTMTFQVISRQLSCIVTAFELLSGQGEALNIDLTDFINTLYAILLPLSFSEIHNGPKAPDPLVLDTLFRALNLIFLPRASGISAPPWRSAAFSKRLLTACLQWPPAAVLRALDFVSGLVAKDAKLEAMLSTEDRIFNGVYRADIDDPQLCHPFESSFWELHTLHRYHWDPRVREEAGKLLTLNS